MIGIMTNKIFFVSSQKMSVISFLLPHLRSLMALGSVSVFVNDKDLDFLARLNVDVPVFWAPIERSIRPAQDIKGLLTLYRSFLYERPHVVHSVTPKAGLLAMAAAWLARVPLRVHTFTGQVWVTRTGPMRILLKMADKMIAAMATDILVDSPSQRDFLIQHGVVSARKSQVLGAGSICGVDTARFRPDSQDRIALRQELHIDESAQVVLYLGRLNKDKGVLDLASAFAKVAIEQKSSVLMIVGPDEENMYEQMLARCPGLSDRIFRVGFTQQPERYMRAADVYCLPSYREGFGSSVIEAAASGIPAVASSIYGLTDAVVDGHTGWLHTPGNVDDLTSTLLRALTNESELKQRGAQARKHVMDVFSQEKITGAMVQFYSQRLNDEKNKK